VIEQNLAQLDALALGLALALLRRGILELGRSNQAVSYEIFAKPLRLGGRGRLRGAGDRYKQSFDAQVLQAILCRSVLGVEGQGALKTVALLLRILHKVAHLQPQCAVGWVRQQGLAGSQIGCQAIGLSVAWCHVLAFQAVHHALLVAHVVCPGRISRLVARRGDDAHDRFAAQAWYYQRGVEYDRRSNCPFCAKLAEVTGNAVIAS
jgi:hypothetical protein